MENNFLPKLPNRKPKLDALEVAEAYANNKSMDATKELLSDDDKIELLEIVSANAEKFDHDDPAWLIIHAITVLKNAESDILKSTTDAVSKEILAAKVASAETQKEVKLYAEKTKKHIETFLKEKLDGATENTVNAINKNIDSIEEKMTREMTKVLVKSAKTESSRHNVNRHQKWAAIAVISSLVIGSSSYYIGRNNNYTNTKNEIVHAKKWENFVNQWNHATDEEKLAITMMMSRKTK